MTRASMLGLAATVLAAVGLAVSPSPSAAKAKNAKKAKVKKAKDLKLGKLTCYGMPGAYKFGEAHERAEFSRVDCVVQLKVSKKAERGDGIEFDVNVHLEVLDLTSDPDDRTQSSTAKKKRQVWPGFNHEVWVSADRGEFSGCETFGAKVTVDGHSKLVRWKPDCPD